VLVNIIAFRSLYSVDPRTGVATPIAATGMPPDSNIPFTSNDDGTFDLCDESLYGVGGKLYARRSLTGPGSRSPDAVGRDFSYDGEKNH
jgi:hypothetical protein